jgi:hypothetical protein
MWRSRLFAGNESGDRHAPLRIRYQAVTIAPPTRRIAGLSGFLTLSQSRDDPDR